MTGGVGGELLLPYAGEISRYPGLRTGRRGVLPIHGLRLSSIYSDFDPAWSPDAHLGFSHSYRLSMIFTFLI